MKYYAWKVVSALGGVVWLGFVLHTSEGEQLIFGKYSATYGAFIALVSFAWLALVIWSRRRQTLVASLLKPVLVSVALTALLAMLVLPMAYIYLHQRSLERELLGPLEPHAHAFFQIERAPDPPQNLPPGTLKVLALGGSTTYGSKLTRDEAYPAILQEILRSQFDGVPITVLNGAVPWHTSMHSLLRYVSRYADWKPNIVIVMHAFNDIFQASEGRLTSGTFRADYGHFFGALGRRVNPHDDFAEFTRRTLFRNWLARTWYSDFRAPVVKRAKHKIDLLRALPSFERNLGELVRRATDDGARVILATQPFSYHQDLTDKFRGDLFYPYYYRDYAVIPTMSEQQQAMEVFNSKIREMAGRMKLQLVDVEQYLPKSSVFMYDDVHYTVAGARHVARIVADGVDWLSSLNESNTQR